LYLIFKHIRVDTITLKLLSCQASTSNRCKNTRSKLLKYNASIYFNKRCLASKVIPKYAHIKFTNNSPATKSISEKAQILRVKNEIKFLYKKKDALNRDLNTLHLKAANEWGNTWPKIQHNIVKNLNHEMEKT